MAPLVRRHIEQTARIEYENEEIFDTEILLRGESVDVVRGGTPENLVTATVEEWRARCSPASAITTRRHHVFTKLFRRLPW